MEWLIERLISLIPAIAGMSESNREKTDNALKAISKALTETRIYIQSIQDGNEPNRETEVELARYWSEAAIPVRHIDEEFADMCMYKSEAWIDPDSWPGNKIVQYGIDIESVKERYEELIRG